MRQAVGTRGRRRRQAGSRGLRAALLGVCALLAGLPSAAAGQAGRRLIVLAVPGLRSDDLARPELPTLRTLTAGGAVGWMNTRTARVPGQRRDPEEAAWLTLGAGARATAGPYARDLTPAALARLKAENARLDHPVPLGALGGMLHAAGLRTAVIGGEDDVAPRRAARLLAMDPAGRVDVDRTDRAAWSRPDVREPYGIRTALRAYARGGAARLQLWIYGDLARAERFAPQVPPATAARQRQAALQRLDILLASYFRQLPPETRVMLLAPAPADSAAPGDRLAPLLLFGEEVEPGLLTSGSTRRAGLISSTDFLPTVADWLEVRLPPGMVGRPMAVAPGPAPTPERWATLHDRWAARAAQQAAFGGLPTLQFLLAAAGIMFLCLRATRSSAKALLQAAGILLALPLLALPTAQLLLPPLSPAPVGQAALLLGAATAATALLGAWRPAWAWPFGLALMGALVLAVPLDLATGGRLQQQAWMSYSVMEGARYYGIGNEYCGAVLAAAMLLAAFALPSHDSRLTTHDLTLTTPALLLLSLCFGAPWMGANAGGFLAMAVGTGTAALVWLRGQLRAREALPGLLLLGALLAALVLLDRIGVGGSQTHIGRAFGGGASLPGIAARKAALNGWLLLHSPWTPGLLVSLAGLWGLWRAPDSRLRAVLAASHRARGAAAGLLTGTAVLLLFNDSGVVAASEALLLTWAAACLWSLRPVPPAAAADPPA